MGTRLYDREIVRYDRAAIDILVEQGRAEYFPGLPGYVIDKKTPVRNHQIDEPAAVEDLAYLRSVIAEDYPHDHYLATAEAEGISVDELTDGEYYVGSDGHVVSAEEEYLESKISDAEDNKYTGYGEADEDYLFAKFGA